MGVLSGSLSSPPVLSSSASGSMPGVVSSVGGVVLALGAAARWLIIIAPITRIASTARPINAISTLFVLASLALATDATGVTAAGITGVVCCDPVATGVGAAVAGVAAVVAGVTGVARGVVAAGMGAAGTGVAAIAGVIAGSGDVDMGLEAGIAGSVVVVTGADTTVSAVGLWLTGVTGVLGVAGVLGVFGSII